MNNRPHSATHNIQKLKVNTHPKNFLSPKYLPNTEKMAVINNYIKKEALEEDISLLELAWNELGITNEYKKVFINVLLNSSEKERNNIITQEKNNMKKFRDGLLNLKREIDNRENNLNQLKEHNFEILNIINSGENPNSINQLLKSIIGIIKNLRINAINIIRKIIKVNHIISYYSNTGKFNFHNIKQEYSYNPKYIFKMKKDLLFLKDSILNTFIEMNNDEIDPFLTNCAPSLHKSEQNNIKKIEIPISDDMMKLISESRYALMQEIVLDNIEKIENNNNYNQNYGVNLSKSGFNFFRRFEEEKTRIKNNKLKSFNSTMPLRNNFLKSMNRKKKAKYSLYNIKNKEKENYLKLFFKKKNSSSPKKKRIHDYSNNSNNKNKIIITHEEIQSLSNEQFMKRLIKMENIDDDNNMKRVNQSHRINEINEFNETINNVDNNELKKIIKKLELKLKKEEEKNENIENKNKALAKKIKENQNELEQITIKNKKNESELIKKIKNMEMKLKEQIGEKEKIYQEKEEKIKAYSKLMEEKIKLEEEKIGIKKNININENDINNIYNSKKLLEDENFKLKEEIQNLEEGKKEQNNIINEKEELNKKILEEKNILENEFKKIKEQYELQKAQFEKLNQEYQRQKNEINDLNEKLVNKEKNLFMSQNNNNNGENNNMINDDKDNNFKKTKLISLQDKIFYNEEKNELEKSNDNITNNEININHIKITNKENKDTENNIKEQYSVDYYRENLFNLLTKLNESIPLNKIPDFLKRAFSMDDSIYSESFYFKGIFPKIIISKNSKGVITGICSFYYESNEDLNENLTLRINTIIVGDDYEDQIIEMVNYIKTEVECDKIVIYILYDKIEDKFVSNAEAKNIFVNKLKFKWLCVVRNEKLNQRYIKYCFIKNEKKYELNGHETTDAINALKHNKNNFLMNNLLIASINTEQNAQLLTEIFSNKICFNKYINPNQIYFLLISNKKIKSEFKDQKKFDELNKILGKIKKYSTFDNNYGKESENENKYIKEEIDKSIYGEIKEVLVKKNINCFPNTSSTKLSLNFETNYSTIIDENYYNRISTEKIKVFEESKTGAKFYLIPSKDNNILFYICELNNNLSNLMIDNDKNVYEKFLEFQPSAQKQIFEFSLKSIRDLSYIPMANKTSAKTIYIPCFSIKTHLFSYKFKEIEKNVKLSDIDTNENLKMTSIDEFINVEFKPDNNIKNSFTTVEGYDYIIKNSFIIGIFDNDIINNEKLPLLQFLYINKDEFLTKSNCNI